MLNKEGVATRSLHRAHVADGDLQYLVNRNTTQQQEREYEM